MAFETKEYLDIDGLKAYTAKILELIAQKADSSVVSAEIVTLKAIIGDINLLGENYKNIVIALLSEVERAKEAEANLTEKITWGSLGWDNN